MERARALQAGGSELESQLGHLLSTAGRGVQPRLYSVKQGGVVRM